MSIEQAGNTFTVTQGIDEEKVKEMGVYDDVLTYLVDEERDSPRFHAVTDYAELTRVESEIALLDLQTGSTDLNPGYATVGAKAALEAQHDAVVKRIETNTARFPRRPGVPGYTQEYSGFVDIFEDKMKQQEESRIPPHPQEAGVVFGQHDALREQLARNHIGNNLGILVQELRPATPRPNPYAA